MNCGVQKIIDVTKTASAKRLIGELRGCADDPSMDNPHRFGVSQRENTTAIEEELRHTVRSAGDSKGTLISKRDLEMAPSVPPTMIGREVA
jgi:hypothetical protein